MKCRRLFAGASFVVEGCRANFSRLLVGLAILVFCPASIGANIFDEDWVPPAHIESAHAVAAPTTSLSDAAAARLAIPTKADLAKSRKLMVQVFARELADRSPHGRQALTRQLLEEQSKNGNKPVDEFVLLTGALQAAREAGDLAVCFDVADRLAKAFDLDALSVKADAAMKMPRPAYAIHPADNIKSALDLFDPLAAAGDFAAASRLGSVLQPIAASDSTLNREVQQRRKDLDALRASHDRLTAQLDKLKKSPDDPAANLAAGSYFCFVSGQWDRGLPMLAKGSDSTLKDLARTDLIKPDAPGILARLGDQWWDFAAKQPGPAHDQICLHAAELYGRAVEGLSGLQRTLIEKRIAEAATFEKAHRTAAADNSAKAGDHWIDLTKYIDLGKDQIVGKWQLADGAITSDGTWGGCLQIDYSPPPEYDLRFEVTPIRGSQAIGLVLVKSNTQFAWHAGSFGNTRTGFETINGQGVNTNASSSALSLTLGHRYKCLIKVRDDGLSVYMDGKMITSYKTDYKNLSIPEKWATHDKAALGLRAYIPATFHSIELLEVTGHGRPLTGGEK